MTAPLRLNEAPAVLRKDAALLREIAEHLDALAVNPRIRAEAKALSDSATRLRDEAGQCARLAIRLERALGT